MKKLLRVTKWIAFTLACFASSTLSAWYDPSGYWGRCHPHCSWDPSRGNYTIRGELLYLRPHVDNVKVDRKAITNDNDFFGIPGLIIFFTNDERERRFKWKPGFKIGLGYACYDCWEADLNWTHYQSRARISDFREAETKWKLQLDMIDLEIGKELWFRRCFRLKPYLGLRYARIRQSYKFEVEGDAITVFLPGVISEFELIGIFRPNYVGIGPRGGFDASWCVGCGFNFYFTAAASYLWGEMENRYRDNFIVSRHDKDHHWEAIGITDISFGIGWSELWWNERRRLTFRFGYEHHFFIHENRFDNVGGIMRREHRNWFVQGVGGSMIVDF